MRDRLKTSINKGYNALVSSLFNDWEKGFT